MRNSPWCWFVIISCCQILISTALWGGETPSARAKPLNPTATEIRDFEVRVDNRPAGTHRLTIKSAGDEHQVAFHTDVRIDFIVYAYVFKFRGTEAWRDGRIEQADIRSEDGGKKKSFTLRTEGTLQQVSFNGKLLPQSKSGVMSTAYWQLPSKELRTSPLLIMDVDTGQAVDASLKLVGPATVSLKDRSLTCQHYKIDGPSPAELWFDEQHRLVRQKSSEEGHSLELRLLQIRTAKDDLLIPEAKKQAANRN